MTGTLGNTGHQHKVRYMDCSIQIGPQPWHRMAQVCWAKTVRGQAAKHHDVGLLLDHWDITWRSHTLHQQFRGLGRNHGPFILEIRQDRQMVLRGSESLQFILLHWANPLVHSKLTKCSWQSEPCCLSRSGSMVKSYKSLTGLFDAGSWQRWPSATAARVVFFSAVPHCCSQSLASRIPHQLLLEMKCLVRPLSLCHTPKASTSTSLYFIRTTQPIPWLLYPIHIRARLWF